MSRRFAAGVVGTRGLLLTVLGKFVAPGDLALPTPVFVDVLGRLGVEEQTSRQTLTRMAAEGWFTSQREGRYTQWRLTTPAREFLTLGGQRIYGFDPAPNDWDGRWIVVLARVPETNRPARHLIRTRMRWAGFGSPAPGVWISTSPIRAYGVESLLEEAGVRRESHVFHADHIAGGDLPTLVSQAWDLKTLEQVHRNFVAEFTSQPSLDPLVSLTKLIFAWRLLALVDPGLPRVLLPAGWIGINARELFFNQHAAWSPAANAEWERSVERWAS